jgi:hypothetical protein
MDTNPYGVRRGEHLTTARDHEPFGWDSGNCFGEGAPSAALGSGFTNHGTRVSPEPPEAIDYNRPT